MPANVPSVWDNTNFARTGLLPSVVGNLHDRGYFSMRSEPIRVLDMLIHAPGQGWRIPSYLHQFTEAIVLANQWEQLFVRHQKGIPASLLPTQLQDDILDYCYITVDQRPVPPGGTQRRDGWHSDAYIVDKDGTQLDVVAENKRAFPSGEWVERTYVTYDCLPTLFADGPWDLGDDPNDCDKVLRSFDEQANGKRIYTYPEYSLLCLDPYCVHSVARNEGGGELDRTFIKIQFSSKRYNREGNTLNPAFDYSRWKWVPRDPGKREHRYA